MTSTHSMPPLASLMLHDLARNWWLLLLRGIVAIVFGILAIGVPDITLATIILLFGAYALGDGIFALAAAVMGGKPAPRWWLVAVGLLGLAVGIATFMAPGITALALIYYIAFWSIVTGAMQIAGAVQLRREIGNEWILIALGVLSVLFGMFLIAVPGAGALGLIMVIGLYALVAGIMLAVLAFRIRKYA